MLNVEISVAGGVEIDNSLVCVEQETMRPDCGKTSGESDRTWARFVDLLT